MSAAFLLRLWKNSESSRPNAVPVSLSQKCLIDISNTIVDADGVTALTVKGASISIGPTWLETSSRSYNTLTSMRPHKPSSSAARCVEIIIERLTARAPFSGPKR